MRRRGTGWSPIGLAARSALRHRRGQTAALLAMSALITACIGFAPVYDRAMQQALVDTLLAQTSVRDRVVAIDSESAVNAMGITQARDPEELRDLVPEAMASLLEPAVLGRTAVVSPVEGRVPPTGQLVWRDGGCEHVRILSGACPAAAGEILVSEEDERLFDLTPGVTLAVAPAEKQPDVPLEVVGTYEPLETPLETSWWQGLRLVGQAAISPKNTDPSAVHDTWLTSEDTFSRAGVLPAETSSASAPIPADATGVEELFSLRQQARQLSRDARRDRSDIRIRSILAEVTEGVEAQSEQARRTVPLLVAPLVVLSLFVLWLVLGAATEQRRGMVAVARLRGRGRTGAVGLLLVELLPVLLLGVVPGVALSLLGGAVARWLLPGSAPVEAGPGFATAIVLALLSLAATTVAAVVRVARQPLDRLVRSDRVRAGGWTLGVLDALLLSAVGTGALAFVIGSLSGSLALAGPALLALLVGLVLAHLAAPAADLAGRRLLDRGRLVGGMTLLDLGRRRETRTVIAVLTVASALAVFSIDALVIGERNRLNASQHEAGAPVVLQLDGGDIDGVRAALGAADPTGRRATPVLAARDLLAVEPDGFRRIAYFPRGAPSNAQWDAIAPPGHEPVTLSGTRVSLTVATRPGFVSEDFLSDASEVRVNLIVTAATGVRETIPLEPVAPAGRTRTMTTTTDVCIDGCRLAAVEISAAQGVVITGELDLAGLEVDGEPVDWDPTPQGWNITRGNEAVLRPVTAPSDDTLRVQVSVRGFYPVELTPAWVPGTVSALLTDAPQDTLQLTTTGVDGSDRATESAGTLALVPAMPGGVSLVDLDAITRGAEISLYSHPEVWMEDDPDLVGAVLLQLRERAIPVTAERHWSAVEQTYDETIPSWSLTLGAAVGPAVVLIALLVLLALVVIGWRERARDLAVLRLNGAGARTTRRLAAVAQLPAVLIAVVGGAAAGLAGAVVAMPEVAFYPVQPDVPVTDVTTAWTAVLAVAATCLVLLPAAAVLAGRNVARQAHLERVREGQ